jgi:hypothetical protein
MIKAMFQTKVEIPPTPLSITYTDAVMTLGSCFAENIGRKMEEVCFDTEVNPFGVLYNPVSIINSIELLLDNKQFTPDDIFESRSLWHSFSHSSLFSAVSVEACLDTINSRMALAGNFIHKANVLLITFGTAWIFEERKSGRVVSNCHKLPAAEFVRRRLTVEEIVDGYTNLINKLSVKRTELKLIFSVSPIRHWKDGAHENNLSKSTLLLAIDELQKRFEQVHYFPAYEIQLDELRDYRFYASDMLHPSDVAVNYIWQRFSETYFNPITQRIKKDVEQLVSDLSHRSLQPDSEEFKKFCINVENRKTRIIDNYPFLSNRIK